MKLTICIYTERPGRIAALLRHLAQPLRKHWGWARQAQDCRVLLNTQIPYFQRPPHA